MSTRRAPRNHNYYMQYDGTQCWHDSNGQPHSYDDCPAITKPGGEEIYYLHGTLHRDIGPAHIHPDGREDWFHHGRQLTAAEIEPLMPAWLDKRTAEILEEAQKACALQSDSVIKTPPAAAITRKPGT